MDSDADAAESSLRELAEIFRDRHESLKNKVAVRAQDGHEL